MKLPIKKRYLFPLILIAAYFLDPRPTFPEIDSKITPLNIPLAEIDDYLAKKKPKLLI